MKKHHTYDLILKLILESFPKNEKLDILDYGCGSGFLLGFLPKERIKKYMGIDINRSSIDAANKKYKGENISFGLIHKNKPLNIGNANTIDVVMAVGVLQYMSNNQRSDFFKEAARILRKDGLFVLSCVTDHLPYKLINLYYLFLPHYYINRKHLINQLEWNNFEIIYAKEKGLIITPFFSNFIMFLFDSLDKIIFRRKGELGPIGMKIRQLVDPLIQKEYELPIDYGNTLFVKSQRR